MFCLMMQSTHFIYSYTASEGWTTEPKTLESGLKKLTIHLIHILLVLTLGSNLDFYTYGGARCTSVIRAFAHGAMGCRIDPSWWTH